MQDVDTFFEARNIEDAVLLPRVDSNLLDAGTYAGHRLPVGGLKSLLNPPKLESGHTPRDLGKCPQIIQRGGNP